MAGEPWWMIGARVELRKPHACGGRVWRITRLGADVGLQCECCSRRLLLARDEFERRLKTTLSSGAEQCGTTGKE